MDNDRIAIQYSKSMDLILNLRESIIFIEDLDNPLLNLGKPTKENLKRIDNLKVRKGNIGAIFNIIIFVPYTLMNLIINCIHHYKYIHHLKALKKPLDKSDYLFLSHYVGQRINDKSDLFFGNTPWLVSANGKKSIVLRINHKKKLEKDSNVLSSALMPKTCMSKYRFQLILRSVNKSVVYFWHGISHLVKNSEMANHLFLLSQMQTKLASFNTEILLSNLTLFVTRIQPTHLVVTLEGHPYESRIAHALAEKNIKVTVIYWQVAPVVPKQHGFLETIEKLPPNSKVATSGSVIKRYIESNISGSQPVFLIGSPKYKEVNLLNRPRNAILLAPEGSTDAVIEFMELIPDLCKKLPNRKIVLRLHPAVAKLKLRNNSFDLPNKSNFVLSDSSLQDDLVKSEFCIFRSSSVGIEALSYRVKPIHFSEFRNGEINPLALLEPWDLEAQNISQLIGVIEKNSNLNDEFLQDRYQQNYSEFNLQKFLAL